jgi:hypothetical protein
MKKWILAVLLLCLAISVAAQDTPSRTLTQPTVLTDLARRVGRGSLTLTDLGDWNWFFGTYNYVIGLGCIGAPTTAPAGGRWQRWEMTYGNTAYVYLITDDAQNIILCNEAALTTPGAPTPMPLASVTPITGATAIVPTPFTPGLTPTAASGTLNIPSGTEIPCALPPRLVIGASGRVTPGDPNWVRQEANRTSAKVGELPGEGTFTVLQGPVCDAASGVNYWYVQGNGVVGWTGEGVNGEYWLEPVETVRRIDQQTAAQMSPASWVTAFPVPIQNVVFSPGMTYFVVIDTTGRAALYNSATQTLIQELRSPGGRPYTQIRFSLDDLALAATDVGNNIYIWDLKLVRPVGQITVDKQITAIAFSMDFFPQQLLAVATEDGQVRLWTTQDVTPQTAPVGTLAVQGAASALEFSPDGRLLIARDVTGKMLALWEVGE